jgi:hypothetical protein
MKDTRTVRVLIASTLLIALASGLVACSKSATVSGSGGITGFDASGSPLASGGPSFRPTPTGAATKPKGGGDHGGGGGKPGQSSNTTHSPSPSSSPPLANDYKIVVWGPCYWSLGPEPGMLLVGTRFKITHTGPGTPNPVPFVLTDNKDHDSATSPGEAVDTIFPSAIGGDIASAVRYPGTLVTVTGTINPGSDDDNPADNKISIGVQVPSLNLPTSTTPSNIPCVAS